MNNENTSDKDQAKVLNKTDVSGSVDKHQLSYSMYSARVSWCDKCNKHFHNERNLEHTTKATSEHYHLLTDR